jgi:hypothetical protein
VSDSSEGSGRIKVVDRRRFTGGGELRPDRPPAVAVVREDPRDGVADEPADPQAAPSPPTSRVFLELVRMLAQQADLLLRGAPGLPPQPEQARIFLEFLAVLETKTRGNLSAEESQVLSSLSFQLRSMTSRRGA